VCWVFLVMAILFEVAGTTCMKLSQGFARILPSILMFALYALSLSCVAMALKRIEVSVAYAVWSAVGTALIAAIGIVWFKESLSLLKVVSLLLIIAGVVGLHVSNEPPPPLRGPIPIHHPHEGSGGPDTRGW